MSCDHALMKYVLFFFNLVVWLLSIGVITFGVLILLNWKVVEFDFITAMPIGLIAIGALMFIITFFGCCGAIRENHCMVTTFALFLLVIIITQVVMTVLMFVYDDEVKNGIVKTVKGLYNKKYTSDADKATDIFVDSLQKQFKCCGVHDGIMEYYKIHTKLPPSCCDEKNIVNGFCESKTYPGCAVVTPKIYENWKTSIAGIIIGVTCAELIGEIIALCFVNSLRGINKETV